jgi:hypothetical protein
LSREKYINMDFESIIERIKKLKGLRDDQEVAALLGLTKGAFSERKRRGSIPKKELELFCERESINIDWLLTGEGEMKKGYPIPEYQSPKGAEDFSIYKDKELAEIMDILQKDLPEAKGAILKILKYRKGLKEGIQDLMEIEKPLNGEG